MFYVDCLTCLDGRAGNRFVGFMSRDELTQYLILLDFDSVASLSISLLPDGFEVEDYE